MSWLSRFMDNAAEAACGALIERRLRDTNQHLERIAYALEQLVIGLCPPPAVDDEMNPDDTTVDVFEEQPPKDESEGLAAPGEEAVPVSQRVKDVDDDPLQGSY